MTDSQQLLAEYASNGSEGAFRELVSRYVHFVYSMALRLVDGDVPLAEDVTQMVFISLARKGRTLSRGVMLGGWLHQHTYHVATRAVRDERRRQAREREAVEMNMLPDHSEAHWRHLSPILDEAITQLGSEDRAAILLRFFEQRDFRSVGEALGSKEDAARMRVNRALEKLQLLLKERGVALSVTALGSALTAESITAAPAGLALAASSAALANAAGSGGTLAFLKFMATTKLKLGLTTFILGSAAITVGILHHRQAGLRDENQSLRDQLAQLQAVNTGLSNRLPRAKTPPAPRLPAPLLSPAAGTPLPAELMPSTNLYALLTNKTSRLTMAQIAPYLEANRRNAASLLAGFRTTGDLTLLEEAMRKYPNDPRVSFEAALRRETLPADRRQWLDTLKTSDPDNPLANYLSAADYFKAGLTDLAVQDLSAAAGKARFQDYSLDRAQADEEAYRAAGYPVAEAKTVAISHLLLPHLVEVRQLSASMVDLANSYRKTGDDTSAQAVLQTAVDLGRHYSEAAPGENLITQLVGVSVERMALNAMDPGSPYGSNGQTVQDRIQQLVQQKSAIKQLTTQADPLWPTLTEQDWISYHSRSMVFGEEAALRWMVGKYGRKL